jgi:hypothetical protein
VVAKPCNSKTARHFGRTYRFRVPENSDIHSHCRGKLKRNRMKVITCSVRREAFVANQGTQICWEMSSVKVQLRTNVSAISSIAVTRVDAGNGHKLLMCSFRYYKPAAVPGVPFTLVAGTSQSKFPRGAGQLRPQFR